MSEAGITVGSLPAALSDAIKNNKIPHAVIIEGGEEQQRRKAALTLAAALVCEGASKPCGACSACKKAAALTHPDIIVLRGTDKPNSIGVDAVRALRHDAFVIPNEADRKVFLIYGATALSEQAQNALLKVLEEPPEYVAFILECPSKDSLLATILSRSAAFSAEGGQTPEQSSAKAEKATAVAEAVTCAVSTGSEVEIMKVTAPFEKDKELFRLAISELQLIFRDALVLSCGGKPASPSKAAALLADRLSAAKLMKLCESVPQFTDMLSLNANHNLMITRLCYILK